MPKLAAFPKAYMNALCKDGTMTVSEWIDMAATLGIDGVELYAGYLEIGDSDDVLLSGLYASRSGVPGEGNR